MAKRKFGQYTVDFKKGTVRMRPDTLIETTATITGDIEIGIDIETMSWREDWLAKQTFGNEADKYRLLNVQNSYEGYDVNHVTAVWGKWHQ